MRVQEANCYTNGYLKPGSQRRHPQSLASPPYQSHPLAWTWLWRFLICWIASTPPDASGQTADGFTPRPDDAVAAMVFQPNGDMLVGGTFKAVDGTLTAHLAKLLPDGSIDRKFNPTVNQSVYCIAQQEDGNVIIGGTFTTVNGLSRNRIARLQRDGNPDTFAPNFDSTIYTLSLQTNGKIVVGGAFTSLGGTACLGIVRLNEDGTKDATFSAEANGNVYALVQQPDGKFLIGGTFTQVNGTARNRIARLNSDGTLDLGFNPNCDATVSSMALQPDGKILVGGNFNVISGRTGGGLARLNADGTADTAYGASANNWVDSIVLQADGQAIIGGEFTSVNSTSRNRVARITATGSLDAGFNPNFNWIVHGLALDASGKLVACGGFTYAGSLHRPQIARIPNTVAATRALTVTGTTQVDWVRGGSAPELERVLFEVSSSSVFGYFTWTSLGEATRVEGGWRLQGLTLPGSAGIRARGKMSGGWFNGSSGWEEQSILYGEAPPQLAVDKMVGNTATAVASGGTIDFGIEEVGQSDPDVTIRLSNPGPRELNILKMEIVGQCSADFTDFGNFYFSDTIYPGSSDEYLIQFSPNASGTRNARLRIWTDAYATAPYEIQLTGYGDAATVATEINPSSGVVGLLPQRDGSLIFGGGFTTAGGNTRNRLAKVSPGGFGLDQNFNPNVGDGQVNGMVEQADGKVLICGSFTTVGGVTRNRIARLNADGSLDTAFNPNAGDVVLSIQVLPDGKILAAGAFTTIGGGSRSKIARLNTDGTLDTSFTATPNNSVTTMLVQADGKIVIGGSFTTVNSTARVCLARLNADGTLDATFNPNMNNSVMALAFAPTGRIYAGGFFTTVGGYSFSRLVRLNTDGTPDFSFVCEADDYVRSLAVQANGSVVFSGDFDTVNGKSRPCVARVQSNGSLDPDLGAAIPTTAQVFGVALDRLGRVVLGGIFVLSRANSNTSSNLAILNNSVSPSQLFESPVAGELRWTPGGSTAMLEQVSFETWNGNGWTSQGSATFSNGTWSRTGLPMLANSWARASGRGSGGGYSRSGGILSYEGSYGTSLPDIALKFAASNLNSGTTFSMGTEQWLNSGAPKTFTIQNAGGSPLTHLAVSMAGTNPADFIVTQPSVTTLAPGATTTFTATFAPLGGGGRQGLLQVASGDYDENPFKVTLYGTSVIPEDTFNPTANGVVNTLAQQSNGSVILGGSFTTMSGQNRGGMARVNSDGFLDASFSPYFSSTSSNSQGVSALLIEPNSSILVGGEFTHVNGVSRAGLVKLLPDGTLDLSYQAMVTLSNSGSVGCLARQTDGKILLAGNFTAINGTSRNSLGRLNEDGSLDTSFVPTVTGVTQVFVQADGKILIGGSFTTVNGTTRNRLARLNANGTLDPAFNPNLNGSIFGYWVVAFAQQPDGKLLIAGDFTTVGGVTRNRLARLNLVDGSLDTTFNPNVNSTVQTLALQANGQILVGGGFTSIGGVTRNYLAKLNADGSLDSSFDPAASNGVSAVALQSDGRVLVGGGFTYIAGFNRPYCARIPNNLVASQNLSLTGNTQIDWARAGATAELEQVSMDHWTAAGWTPLGAATRVSGGWRMTGLALPAAGQIRARGTIAGGYGGSSRGSLQQVISYGVPEVPDLQVAQESAILADGAEALPFPEQDWLTTSTPQTFTLSNVGTSNLTGLVVTVEGVHAGDFLVGVFSGSQLVPGANLSLEVTFRPRGGGRRSALLRIASNDPDEHDYIILISGVGMHRDAQFYPSFNNGSVYTALQSTDGLLNVAGAYTTLNGGYNTSDWSRFSAAGQLDTSFAPPGNTIYSLAEQANGKIIASSSSYLARYHPDGTLDASFNTGGGSQNSVLIQPDGKVLTGYGNGLVRMNTDGTTDSTFTVLSINGEVRSLVLQSDGKVVIGGAFTTVGGTARNSVARLNANGSLDTTYNPASGGGAVNALALQADGKIIVANHGIYRLNTDGTTDPTLSVGTTHPTTPTIRSLTLQTDGSVLVGGTFSTINHLPRKNLARLSPTGVVDPEFDPGATGDVEGITVLPDGNIAVVGAFTELGGVLRSGLARIPNNVSAARSLTATGTTQLDWQVGGGSPAMEQVVFESWNGTAWTNLGAATRVAGGWRKTGLSLPVSTWIRATGRSAGGRYAGSSPLVRDVIRLGSANYPTLVVEESGGAVLPKSSLFDFGTVSWPNQSSTKIYTIRNTGSADLTSLAFSTTEATTGALNDFHLTLPSATTLAAGASTTFQVQFAPQYSRSRKVNLSITSNDPISSPFGLSFFGTANYASPNPFSATMSSGSVELLVPLPDGKTLVAAPVSFSGSPTIHYLARLTSSGQLDATFNANLGGGYVYAICQQLDGRLLLGGSFTSILGQTRNRVARLNADGTLDAGFNPNVDGDVNSMLVGIDGKIILAGNFTMVGGVARNRLARLNADGSLDASYNPGADAYVNCIALQPDGKLIVGGNFAQIAGVARAKLARLLPSGTLDTSFVLPTMTGVVNCLSLLSDGRVLAGVLGAQIGGVNWNSVALFSSTGVHDISFAGLKDVSGGAYSIAVQADGKVLVGGQFSDYATNPPRRYFVRLLANGSVDTTFNPDPSDVVYGLSLQENGQMLVGGSFSQIGGENRPRLARLTNQGTAARSLTVGGPSSIQWDATGGAPLLGMVTLESWNGSAWISHPVTANGSNWQSTGLTLPAAGWVRATGWAQGGYHNSARWQVSQIASYGASGVPDIAVEDPPGSALTPNTIVNLGTSNYNQATAPKLITVRNVGSGSLLLQSLALSGSHPTEFSTTPPADLDLAPGESTTISVTFTPLGAGARSAFLEILSSDADGSPFRIILNGSGQMQDGTPDAVVNSAVLAFAPQPDGRMLIGGGFTQVNGQAQAYLARLNADGSWDASFRPSLNSGVNAIAVNRDCSIFIGGHFTQVNGTTRNRLARLLPDGSLDAAFDPNLNSSVQSLFVLPDGKLLVAGDLTTAGGIAAARLVRLLPNGNLDVGFNANANGNVSTFALQPDGKMLVGGNFTSIGGAARNQIARLNTDGTADATFNPDANGTVTSLCLLPSGHILAGGAFTTIQGISRSRLARLQATGALDTSFDLPLNSVVYSIVPQIDGKIFVGGNFTTVGSATRNRLLRLNADGSLDSSFDPSADNQVTGLAVAVDGSIFVGGNFSNIGGLPQSRFVRLPNDTLANQTLSATGSAQLDWLRSGSAPEVSDVRFSNWNGTAWQDLGAATAIAGGWRKTGLSLPANALVRGEGRTKGGYFNGSSGMVAQVVQLGTGSWPSLTVLDSSAAVMSGGTAIDFANQPTGSASAARTYTLRNDGPTLLTGVSVSLVGAATGEFLLIPPAETQLAPGATTTFSLQYVPQSWGSHFASVQIQSLDPQQPILGFPVSGASGGLDLSFVRNDSAASGYSVSTSLTLRNGKMLIGGNQVRYFGVNTSPAYDALERRHADGSLDQTFNPQMSSSGSAYVYTLAEQDDGKILVGGSFTSVAGQTAVGLVRLNQDGTRDTTFNASMLSGQVRHLILLPNGNILAGGSFTSIGGQSRNGLALLLPNGTADPAFNPTPGNLSALALQPDGKILISGSFTTIGGVVRQQIARLLPDGSLDSAFNPSLNVGATAIALQGDKILLAGSFTLVNGVTQNYLARLNLDGTLDATFTPNPNQVVTSLVVQQDGRSYVAGSFTTINGQSRWRLARLLADGGVDATYNPADSNSDSLYSLYSLSLTNDGALVVTGGFYSFNGTNTRGVVKLFNNMSTEPALAVNGGTSVAWTDAAGLPELYQGNLSAWNGSQWVAAAATSRTTTGWEATIPNLPAGGWVKLTGRARGGNVGGSSAIIERILAYGTAPQPRLQVESADLQILTNGQSTIDFGSVDHPQTMREATVTLRNLGTAALENISFNFTGSAAVEFSLAGTPPTSLAAGASMPVTLRFTPLTLGMRSAALTIQSNDAGATPFTLDLKGLYADDGFSQAPNSYVYVTLPLPEGSTLVGGAFTTLGGQTRNRLAKLRPDYTVDSGFNPNANSSVEALALMPDGKILAGGSFTTIGGLTRRGIARLNADGSADPSWECDVAGVNSMLPLPDGKTMIGGYFTSVQGIARQGIARLNANGSLDTSWNAQLTGSLLCLSRQADGKLIIGGAFTQVAGRTRTGLARLNANGTLDLAFNPLLGQISSSVNVNTMAIQNDGRIVISGGFGSVNGVTKTNLARLESDGTLDASFSMNLSGYADSMQLQADGGMIIGGTFTLAGSALRNRLLRLLPNGSVDPDFDPNVSGRIYSVGLRRDGMLLVGGEFGSVGGVYRPFLAWVGAGQVATDELSVIQANQVTWTRGGGSPEISRAELERFDGAAWIPLAQGTRITGGWNFTGIALPISGELRARGWMSAGKQNGSWTLVEVVENYALPVAEIAIVQTDGAEIISGVGSVNFGPLDAANGVRTFSFDLSNTGTAALQLTGTPQVTVGGTHAAEFTVSNQPASSVSPNGSTSFSIAFDPAALGLRTATVSIANNDPTENPFTFVIEGTGTSPQWLFDTAMQAAGLNGANALALAIPHQDGVSNLLKYAFNLNLQSPDARGLVPEVGTEGLPSITYPSPSILRVELIRRIGSGLHYTPIKSREMQHGTWLSFVDVPTVTNISPLWERVVYEEPVLVSDARWFAQVCVGFEPWDGYEWVSIGDLGNSPDPLTSYGAVPAPYQIAAYEVTISQYTEFLNSVAVLNNANLLWHPWMATDLNILGISRSGTAGSYHHSVVGSGDRPIAYISWQDAARFVNWLHNGKSPAGTETGVYDLGQPIASIVRLPGAKYFLPSEDEWYKAAHHIPGGANYHLYPTGSSAPPANNFSPLPNHATFAAGDYTLTPEAGYSSSVNYLTPVCSFLGSGSPWGTFDQAGNVWEWTDSPYGTQRVTRGGSWGNGELYLRSTSRTLRDVGDENSTTGFRIAKP